MWIYLKFSIYILYWYLHLIQCVVGVGIDIVRKADNHLCENGQVSSIGPADGYTWTLLDLLLGFFNHSYRYQQVGISYKLAVEVIDIKCILDDIIKVDTIQDCQLQYTKYATTRVIDDSIDIQLIHIFNRLILLQCTQLCNLEVYRSYDHPVFGPKFEPITMGELTLEPRLTIYDISNMLSVVVLST
jgi:hypothetical protein